MHECQPLTRGSNSSSNRCPATEVNTISTCGTVGGNHTGSTHVGGHMGACAGGERGRQYRWAPRRAGAPAGPGTGRGTHRSCSRWRCGGSRAAQGVQRYTVQAVMAGRHPLAPMPPPSPCSPGVALPAAPAAQQLADLRRHLVLLGHVEHPHPAAAAPPPRLPPPVASAGAAPATPASRFRCPL